MALSLSLSLSLSLPLPLSLPSLLLCVTHTHTSDLGTHAQKQPQSSVITISSSLTQTYPILSPLQSFFKKGKGKTSKQKHICKTPLRSLWLRKSTAGTPQEFGVSRGTRPPAALGLVEDTHLQPGGWVRRDAFHLALPPDSSLAAGKGIRERFSPQVPTTPRTWRSRAGRAPPSC